MLGPWLRSVLRGQGGGVRRSGHPESPCRPVYLLGRAGGRCPPKGRGCWASRTKAAGAGKELWPGLMALKKRKHKIGELWGDINRVVRH